MADLPTGRQARTNQNYVLYVYVISSKTRKYAYVGLTNDPERRIAQHQKGKEKTTNPYKPFDLVYLEKFSTRIEARMREKYLKSGVGKEWIKSNFSSKI